MTSTAKVPTLLVGVVVVTALALNQSAHVFGFNASIADPLLLVGLVVLIASDRLLIPPQAVVFFAILVATTVAVALFVTPVVFDVIPSGGAIAGDLLKLVVLASYLVLGYSIAASSLLITAVKWFSYGAALVAALSIFLNLTGIAIFSDTLYFAGIRYRGLMSDPNYYSLLACAAIPYFARAPRIRMVTRGVVMSVLAYSVFLSGSKTGLVALLLVGAILAIEHALMIKRSVGLALLLVLVTALVALSWNGIVTQIQALVAGSDVPPSIRRVSELLTDPVSAANAEGSIREDTWTVAVAIIAAAPLVGIGVGSYAAVSLATSGRPVLAHNTYLQLAAEWGTVLTAAFFVWVATLLVRASRRAAYSSPSPLLVVRDVVAVFLIGSLGLSLNNARMFWLFLGGLLFLVIASRDPAFRDEWPDTELHPKASQGATAMAQAGAHETIRRAPGFRRAAGWARRR
jgi:O-antigen ligase